MLSRALILAFAAALACTHGGDPPRPSDETSTPSVSPTPSDPAPTRPADAEPADAAPAEPAAAPAQDPQLVGYPIVRLRSATNPVAPLDFPLPAAKLKARGVKTYRAFAASAPEVWLLVFEFETQSALLAQAALLAQDGDALVPEDGPPHHRKTSYTGRWLLLTGFPSEKPASPEMEFARGDFIGSFAGEE